MVTYNVTPANEITKSQAHVKDLNANVAVSTFPSTEGEYCADLYKSSNECPLLVYSGGCAPIHSKFITTVTIKF